MPLTIEITDQQCCDTCHERMDEGCFDEYCDCHALPGWSATASTSSVPTTEDTYRTVRIEEQVLHAIRDVVKFTALTAIFTGLSFFILVLWIAQ